MKRFKLMTGVRVSFAALALSLTACGGIDSENPSGQHESELATGSQIASIAAQNVGKGPCDTNSAGGDGFYSSCHEQWCADFARWVWAQSGVANTSDLHPAAGSFYLYGQKHGTLHTNTDYTPRVGDAVVFNYGVAGAGTAKHVALVSKVNANGTIETISGNWSNRVQRNQPAYRGTVGTTPSVMGQKISAFVSPVGVASATRGTASVYGVLPDGRLTYTAIDAASGDRTHGAVTSRQGLGFGAKAMATLNFNTLLVTNTSGQLHRVDIITNGATLEFNTPVPLGGGWTHNLLAFDGASLFGIANGALRRYRIGVSKPTAADITNNTLIGNGFSLKTLSASGRGWILGTTADGKLLSYQIRGASDFSRYELRSSTWQIFSQLLSPGGGVYYGQTSDGALRRYLDASPFDGNGGDIAGYSDDPVDSTGWSQALLSAQPNTVTGS